jgi:hypothetical protein
VLRRSRIFFRLSFILAVVLSGIIDAPCHAAESSLPAGDERAQGLYLGVGWPDGMLRYNFQAPVDIEAKCSAGDGLVVPAGRVYWDFLQNPRFDLYTGAELGYIDIRGADSLNGYGMEGGLFIGGQAKVCRWLLVTVDFGPTWLNLQSYNQGLSAMEWIVYTGVYVRIF